VFYIFFTDLEPPVIDFCQSPPIFLVDSKADLDKGYISDIEWTEPIFHDNSLDDISTSVEITTHGEPTFGHYVIGETAEAAYTATDSSGNNVTCTMKITVQSTINIVQFLWTYMIFVLFIISEHHCLLPADPINGHKNCSEAENAVYCTLTCQDGFAFAFQNLEDYFCPTQVCLFDFNFTDWKSILQCCYVASSLSSPFGSIIRHNPSHFVLSFHVRDLHLYMRCIWRVSNVIDLFDKTRTLFWFEGFTIILRKVLTKVTNRIVASNLSWVCYHYIAMTTYSWWLIVVQCTPEWKKRVTFSAEKSPMSVSDAEFCRMTMQNIVGFFLQKKIKCK